MFRRIRSGKNRRIARMFYGYFKRCPYCGYSGGGWGDSGECPSCGETS